MSSLKDLQRVGQAIWLDYIKRSLITGGELKRMVDEGLRGVTSNPTIFEKAIAGSDDYDEAVSGLLADNPRMEAKDIYMDLVVTDIQMAADVLRPVYDDTDGADGFVSLELDPDLAYDTKGSIQQAREFWKTVDRPNVMIKVPATPEGIPTIETLIAEGINVNVTLMFNLDHYEAVAKAYINGIEKCDEPAKVASVASFFLSRIDTQVDKGLEETGSDEALALQGKTAIASSKVAYKRFKELFSGPRWDALAQKGAKVQRPLWASTGTKNPAYSDILYLETIMGPDTVNTLPPATIKAFLDHGKVESTLETGGDEAEADLKKLEGLGIDLKAITEKLQLDGAGSFAKSFDDLMETLAEKRQTILSGRGDSQVMNLGEYQKAVDERIKVWEEMNFSRRLWEKDHTLWSEDPTEITNRLGWLFLPENMHEHLDDLVSFAEDVKTDGIRHVVLLGMGGSSMAPEVYQKTFGNANSYPELIVLDSTHPDAVKGVEERVDLTKTIFVVASKSGTTLETLSFFRYFYHKVSETTDNPGRHFVAITDAGTSLENLAKERGFRRTFTATPDLGGRYSALTMFGLVPAALIGMDVHKFLERACMNEEKTSGLRLGASLGELAKVGRDKVSFLASDSIESFPVWLEQLIAESTGKDGKGIVPIVNMPVAPVEYYGSDRVFVYFRLDSDDNSGLDKRFEDIKTAGHPTIKIDMKDAFDIGKEIFRWEVAVAAAGAALGIQPFNQPDVELAKQLARDIMDEGGSNGSDDIETIDASDNGAFSRSVGDLLGQVREGDYVAIHAYLKPTPDATRVLQEMRLELLNRLKVATIIGYGPRFLHSIGQLYKGGQDTGVFIQLVDEPASDLAIPETDYSFGSLIEAQAIGDYLAMKKKGRRVIRINIKGDPDGGLKTIHEIIKGG